MIHKTWQLDILIHDDPMMFRGSDPSYHLHCTSCNVMQGLVLIVGANNLHSDLYYLLIDILNHQHKGDWEINIEETTMTITL